MFRKTWEKAVYHLLMKYRLKQLENYNMDEDEVPAEPKKRATSKRVPAPAIPEPTKPAADPAQRSTTPQNEPAATRPLPITPSDDDSAKAVPSRPDAPTPRRSAIPPPIQVPTSQPASQRTSTIIVQDASSPEPEVTSPMSIPEITLQGATPARAPADRRASAQSTQSTGSANATSRAASPILNALAPLQVPQVQDAAVQNFLKQVADTLNAMQAVQMRQSIISQAGFSPDLQAALSLSLQQGIPPGTAISTAFRSNVPAEAPPPTPLDGAFIFNEGRYEDAPEGYDASRDPRSSVHGNAYSTPYSQPPSNRSSAIVERQPYGLGIAGYSDNQQSRPRPQSHHSRPPSGGPYYPPPPPQSRRVSPVPVPTGRGRSLSQGSDQTSDKENGGPSGQWNTYAGGTRPRANSHHVPSGQEERTLKPRASILSDGGSSARRTPMGEKHVQIVLPTQDDSWSSKKRRSIYSKIPLGDRARFWKLT